jgi:hypothetical protein
MTKQKPPPDNPEQSARFVETARDLAAKGSREFSKVFKAIIPKKKVRKKS